MRTRALDETIGQEALALGVIELLAGSPVYVAAFELSQKHRLGGRGVTGSSRRGEQIPLQAKFVPLAHELVVVAPGDLCRFDAFVLGPHGDRRAVHVGSAHHQHFVTHDPLLAGEYVCGQIGASQVAKMARSGGVGPGDRNKDGGAHKWSRLPVWPGGPRDIRVASLYGDGVFPLTDDNPTMRTAWVTVVLIVINVLVFVGPQGRANPENTERDITLEYAAIPCEVVTGDGLTDLEIMELYRGGDDTACDLDLSLIHI